MLGDHELGAVVADRYRIVRLLGKGGSARTYAAETLDGQKRVALKHISLGTLDDWKIVQLFERESRILANLEHPAIPRYIDHFSEESERGHSFYLAQELAPGRSLAEWRLSGWLPAEAEVKRIALELLEVLRYLHSRNPPVIHRDIKPQNIIRDDSGKCWLVDFGAVRDTPSTTLTAGSTVVGTYGYMAPEQLHGSARPASDIYGLACTLLFLLTGRPPSELPHRELRIDFRKHVNVSPAFASWLERATDPVAERRFASAHLALVALKEGRTSTTTKTSPLRLGILLGVLVLLAGIAVPLINMLRVDEPKAAAQKSAFRKDGLPPRLALARYADIAYDRDIPAHFSAIFSMAFTGDGSGLFTGSHDQTIKLWNLSDGKSLRSFPGHTARIGGVRLTSDGRHLVTAAGDRTIRVWEASNGKPVRSAQVDVGELSTLSLSPDGTIAATAGMDGRVRMWRVPSLDPIRVMDHSPGKGRVLAVAFGPDGRRIASGGDDGMIRVWNADTGALDGTLDGHKKAIDDIAFAPDGQTLVSGSDDHTARIWLIAARREMKTLAFHTDEVWAVTFSPDGNTIVTGGKDGLVGVWSTMRGELREEHNAGAGGVLDLAFSPSGNVLATGHGAGIVRLWNVAGASQAKVPTPRSDLRDEVPTSKITEERLVLEAHALMDRWSGGDELTQAEAKIREAFATRVGYAPAIAANARVVFKRAYLRGQEYEPAGLAAASAEVNKALAIDPKLVEGLIVRAWVERSQKQLEKAKATINQAIALDATSARAALLASEIALDSGNVVLAESMLTPILEKSTNRDFVARAYSQLTSIYGKRKDYAAMDSTYQTLMKIDPESAWHIGNYANFLFNRGEYVKAAEVAQAAIAKRDYGMAHSTLSDAYTGQGVEALWDRGDTERAKKLFEQALLENPRNDDAYFGLGAVHLAKKSKREAKKMFERAVELEPKNEQAKAVLAAL